MEVAAYENRNLALSENNVHFRGLVFVGDIGRIGLDSRTGLDSPFKLTRVPQAHSNDVVVSSLCPPRRWSDAGVGIGILRGKGDHLATLLHSHIAT